MKRTFVKISVFAVTFGVVLASCNNEAENAKLQEADDLAVQGLVDAKLASLDSSVQAEWNAKVLAAADSVLAASKHKAAPAHHAAAKSTAPVAKKEESKPVAPVTKADKMGGTSAAGNTSESKASKMGGVSAASNTATSKASKMGGTH